MVRSLVIYDWIRDKSTVESREIFDQIISAVGRPPDIATVADESDGKDYLYGFFVKRDVIKKKKWLSLGYLWKRSETVLSDFAIDLSISPINFKCFEIHIDHSAVDNIDEKTRKIVGLIANSLEPIYGIGYDMPYYYGPRAFAQGSSSSRFATSDKSLYRSPARMREQSFAFGPTFRASPSKRGLNVCFRDIFEINFISEGHLNRQIHGVTLQKFIVENGFGSLKQLTAVTWMWGVPPSDIQRVRKIMIEAEFTIVKE